MANAVSNATFPAVFLAVALFISGVLGDLNREFTCEQLDRSTCAFAVSSSGQRCVLEKHVLSRRKDEYTCRNSGVEATSVAGWIATDECVAACGLDRDTFGISSDSLLDRRFKSRLCSPDCFDGCFNVFDFYSNVAASEGVSLTNLCGWENNRREMNELHTAGISQSSVDEAAGDARAPGSDPGYYYYAGETKNGKLISDMEAAAAPNPGHRNLLVGRLAKNNKEFTAAGEAAAPNPWNHNLLSDEDLYGVPVVEKAASPTPGNHELEIEGWRKTQA